MFSKAAGRFATLLFFSLFVLIGVQAQTPVFTYQGSLTDGLSPAVGTYEMQFALFDAATGGTQIGSTITNSSVSVANGIFTVQLDFSPATPFADGANRWLAIAVRKASDLPGFTPLNPRQQITSSPYSIRTLSANAADSLSTVCQGCVDNAKINSVDGAKVTGSVANATTAATATNNVLKAGDTMSGTLNMNSNNVTNVGTLNTSGRVGIFGPTVAGTSLTAYVPGGDAALQVDANGVKIGDVAGNAFGNYFYTDFEASPRFTFMGAQVGIGTTSPEQQLDVRGNLQIPAANNYGYRTARTRFLTIGPENFLSVNPAYTGRIDDGFSSANIHGLGTLWATGGTPGTVAYFIAPVQLPDGATISGFKAQLVKNGGSLQSVVELYRSDSSGYSANTAQLIATTTTTASGGIVWNVSASSINASFNLVDNSTYRYFIRYSGEQATQNVRFSSATITFTVTKVD